MVGYTNPVIQHQHENHGFHDDGPFAVETSRRNGDSQEKIEKPTSFIEIWDLQGRLLKLGKRNEPLS
jgi:hypothetical protein